VPASPRRKISRFVVMAMLQAARARRLGLPDPSAYSWGLNRAIFYAAAKLGFKGGGGAQGSGAPSDRPADREWYTLGQDRAQRAPGEGPVYFEIGGETQTPENFERQIATRFGSHGNFLKAWKEASEIVGQYDKDVLDSGPEFFARVYRPRRDELAARWTDEYVRAEAPAD
jgi:hypothetical protein